MISHTLVLGAVLGIHRWVDSHQMQSALAVTRALFDLGCLVAVAQRLRRAARRHARRFGDLDVGRLHPLLSAFGIELDLIAFIEVSVAVTGDRREVNEQVLAAAFLLDETEAFFAVKPFDFACCHNNHHLRPT